jgi:hypothetical protein
MANNQRPWSPPQMAWSSVLTVFVLIAIGFGWFGIPGFGWVTGGGADRMVQAAVTERLVPICVAQARQAPEADLTALKATGMWDRRDFVEGKGWATMPGSSSPETGVATLCVDALLQSDIDETLGALQPYGDVNELGKDPEFAARPAAKFGYRGRRL